MQTLAAYNWVTCAGLSGLLGLAITLACEADAAGPTQQAEILNGEQLFLQFGCDGCHRLDGLSQAQGRVGPSLNAFARRSYISGLLPNSRANLTKWLLDPQAYHSESAMPNLSLTPAQAQAIALYLWRY